MNILVLPTLASSVIRLDVDRGHPSTIVASQIWDCCRPSIGRYVQDHKLHEYF